MVRIAAPSSEERERVTCDSGDGLPGPCSVSLLPVEVSTGLRKITHCPEKTSTATGAFSLLKGPTTLSALRIYLYKIGIKLD